MKKLYVFLAVIFAFALSLTGCNNQGGSSVNYGEYGVSYEDTQSSTEPESSSEQVLEQDNSSEEGQGASSELKTATYTVNGVDFKMIWWRPGLSRWDQTIQMLLSANRPPTRLL